MIEEFSEEFYQHYEEKLKKLRTEKAKKLGLTYEGFYKKEVQTFEEFMNGMGLSI